MTNSQPTPLPSQPLLYLVYAGTDLPIPSQGAVLERLPPLHTGEPPALAFTQQVPNQYLGTAVFGDHLCHLAGLAMPLPQDLLDHTVMISPWGPQIKAAMRHHRSQVSLVYAGGHPDPIEQMIALYSLAHTFETEDLLGIVNPHAWTAHPPADFLSPRRIAQYQHNIPFDLWLGYVRVYIDDRSFWLVTKGHHIFDVPDLAFFVQPDQDPEAVINLFINVFYYLYEEDVVVTAGDSLEIQGSGQPLRFSEVTELDEMLMGPAGTLVITQDDPKS